METEGAPESVLDLVEPTSERRLRNAFEGGWTMFYDFPEDPYYREWQLRGDTNALSRILESPEDADQFFPFLFNDDPQTRIVWLSETHHLVCEGPNAYRDSDSLSSFLGEMNCGGGELVLHLRRPNSSSKFYSVRIDNVVGTSRPGTVFRDFEEAPGLVTLLLQMTARDVSIDDVSIDMRQGTTPPVAGVEYLVSMAKSRRTVEYRFRLPAQVADVLAVCCNPCIELVVELGNWKEGREAALADAMRSNRCPHRMVLRAPDKTLLASSIAPALSVTTRIEEITIKIDSYSCRPGFAAIMEAVGQNNGIQVLKVTKHRVYKLTLDPMHVFWKFALKSPTVHTIDATGMQYDPPLSALERRTNACLVAHYFGADNSVVTRIDCNDDAYDPHIMRARVVPRLLYNRFRPLVCDELGGSGAAEVPSARGRVVSGLLGSGLVRSRPEFLFLLLKQSRGLWSLPSSLPGSEVTRGRKRPGAKGAGCLV